jgi:hypothetical protein
VVLGDGSPWICNTARELFPQAAQILDRYHAKEALHRTAQSIFGATGESQQWATLHRTGWWQIAGYRSRAPFPFQWLCRGG